MWTLGHGGSGANRIPRELLGGEGRERGTAGSRVHLASSCGQSWGRDGADEVARWRQGAAAAAACFPAKGGSGLGNKLWCKLE